MRRNLVTINPAPTEPFQQANKSPRRQGTIRSRLLVAFLVMALLPALAIGASAIAVGYYSGHQQTLARLGSVAARKESDIEAWTQSLQTELLAVLNEPYMLSWTSIVLDLARDNKFYDVASGAVRNRFQRFLDQSLLFEEIVLLDPQGHVVASSDPTREGTDLTGHFPALQPPAQPQTRLIRGFSVQEPVALLVLVPVTDDRGQVLGTMAGHASLLPLLQILGEPTGLGRTGRTYLIDRNRVLLAAESESTGQGHGALVERNVQSPGIDAAVTEQADGSGVYNGTGGVRVLGVHRWLKALDVALLVEQNESEALGAIVTTLGVTLAVVLGGLLLAVIASWAVARSISRPLVDLVDAASQIAGGDLERVAEIEQEDEIGALARAFNSMTAQLRELINNLEERVRDRTRALRQRALQLETSARVSREITSILDIDDLLARVTELIRDAFGYYQVHIYLVDREADALVLTATSAAAGLHHQRLRIGGDSLNGQVARNNEAFLVNDVAQEPCYLPDELLPDTGSELVIPLRLADEVIGTLDVQSSERNAFAEQDALVIQSLGDQIAIAIENARLYERTRDLAVLEERNRLARELHDSVTQALYGLVVFAGAGQEVLDTGGIDEAKQHLGRIEDAAQQALREMRLLVYELRPPALEEEGLVGALRHRLETVERRTGVAASLQVDGVIDLPAPVEEGLYRIAQEALNNALKHAAASSVTVRIHAIDGHVELEVIDDGAGFDLDTVRDRGGVGLASMRERAEQLGGKFQIQSASGAGTTVRASEIPSGNTSKERRAFS